MKRVLLSSVVIFTSLLFANTDTLFDISKLHFGAIKFKTNTKMRIYNKGATAFNLPIEIDSRSEAIKKTENGYIKESTFKIKFSVLKSDKMTITTQTSTEYDIHHRLTKLTEKINRNGEEQIVTCVPYREGTIQNNFKKEVGYTSDVFLLVCDNHTQKKMQSKLQKISKNDYANFTTKKNFVMINENTRYKIEETTKMTIDKEGNIKKISSKIKAKDLFTIKYATEEVCQAL